MVHIFRETGLNALRVAVAALVSLPLFLATPAFAITCGECQQIEKERRAYNEELEQKGQELKAAFEKRAYDKVAQINVRLSEVRKQLTELGKHRDACANACKPEVIKAEECHGIKVEIRKLESEGAQSPDQIKKIDDLYLNLLKCNQDMRRLLGEDE